MSTVQKVNFEPVSDINPIHRRDVPLADPTLANPGNAVCLVDGEWMTLDNNGKLVRGSNVAVAADPATKLCFPLFAERGRYDVQAMAERKMPILFLGQYEFETRIYDAAANSGGGTNPAIASVLQPLRVATIALGGRNYTGLIGGALNDNVPIIGYVTRLPASNGGKLRFISGWAVRNGAT